MEKSLTAATGRRRDVRLLPAAALTALGVVYGDIGTSALYGFKQAAEAAGTTSPEATMGIVCIRGDAEPSLIRLFLAGFSHGSNRWFE